MPTPPTCAISHARPHERAPDADDFNKARAEISASRKRLVAACAAGTLTEDDITAHVAALDREVAAVNAEAAKYAARSTGDTIEARTAALAHVDEIAADWTALTTAERREVIAILAERIVLPAEGPPLITWADASVLASSLGVSTNAAPRSSPASPPASSAQLTSRPASAPASVSPSSERRPTSDRSEGARSRRTAA